MKFTGHTDKHGNPIYLFSTVRQWLVDSMEPAGGFWWYTQVKLDSVGDYRLYQDGIRYETDEDALLLEACHWDMEVVADYYSVHYDSDLLRNIVRRHYWDGHKFDFEQAEANNVFLNKEDAENDAFHKAIFINAISE
jgi:hypothetical protein